MQSKEEETAYNQAYYKIHRNEIKQRAAVYKYLTFHGMDIFEGPDRTAWLWEMYNNGSN
jgi:hypothetical protein